MEFFVSCRYHLGEPVHQREEHPRVDDQPPPRRARQKAAVE